MLAARFACKAIRLRCLDCSGNSPDEVAKSKFSPDYPTNPCRLHPYSNVRTCPQAGETAIFTFRDDVSKRFRPERIGAATLA
jgi:hypothetical protein